MPNSCIPSVFLSHAHVDRDFARSLKSNLEDAGARVWIDEAELLVGDSLDRRIGRTVEGTDFLIVVLSPAAVKSEWVTKEVKSALDLESELSGIRVLPIIHRRCTVPDFLSDKVCADFSSWTKRASAHRQLLRRLGLVEKRRDVERELERCASSFPLLRNALDELTTAGD